MSDYNLGTASGRIEVDGKAAALGFKVAQSAADSFFQVLKLKVQNVQNLGKRMAAVGTAGAIGFGTAVKVAADFEQQMSGVTAVVNGTEDEMEALRQKALDLGRDTVYSASEAAAAIEELAKAGVPVEDILNGAAEGAVALAAAGGVGLEQAATIASNAMNQFGIEADKVVDVADVLAGVANVSAADVSSLGESLSQAGAVANLAGLSFRDTAIALGEMADAGINGSDAGTSLKTMLNNLIPVTDKQIKKFEELGLITFSNKKAMETLRANGVKPLGKDTKTLQKQLAQLGAELSGSEVGSSKQIKTTQQLALSTGALRNQFFDTEGNVKNLAGLQGTLGRALKGMTKQQKLATLETLFGADAMRASAILSLAGAKGYKQFSKDVSKTKASDVAAKRLDNLKGSMEAFRGSMETAMITIGSIFLPVLNKIVQGLTAVVNVFNNLPKGVQIAIGVLLAVASAGLLVVGMFLALLPLIVSAIGNFLLFKAIGSITKGFRVFFTTLRGGTGVMAASRAAAATTGGAFQTMGKRSLLGGKLVLAAGKLMRAAWVMATGPIGLVVAAVAALIGIGVLLYKKWTPFRELVDRVAGSLKVLGTLILGKIVGALKTFAGFITSSVMPALRQVGSGLLAKIIAAFRELAAKVMSDLVPAARDLAKQFNENVVPALKKLWAVVSPVLAAIGKLALLIGGVLLAVVIALGKAFIKYVLPVLIKIAGFIGGVLIDTLKTLISGVIDVVTGIIKVFSGLIKFFTGLFTGNWSKMWQGIKDIVVGIWKLIVGAVKIWFSVGILKVLGLGMKALLALFKNGWKFILAVFKGAGKGLWAAVKWFLSLILKGIKGYINFWKAVFRNGWRIIKTVVTKVVTGIKNFVLRIFRAIGAFLRGNVNDAKSIMKGGWNTIKETVVRAVERMWNGAKRIGEKLFNWFKDMPGKIVDKIGDVSSLLLQKGKDLVQGIIDGIGSMAKKLYDKMKDTLGPLGKLLPGSPIKDGPLVKWNHGAAGKKLMNFLADGINEGRKAALMAAVKTAGAISDIFSSDLYMSDPAFASMAAARQGVTPMRLADSTAGRRRPKKAKNTRLRLVSGRLVLDKSGRAFIRAVAEEVVDNDKTYAGRRNRQGKGVNRG
jgi:TP901 family phage tail tape measure protein